MRVFVRVAVVVSLSMLAGPAALVGAIGQQTTSQSTPPAGAPTPQDQGAVFRGGTNLVTVDAYPLKDGKILEGLTAKDFQVFEDGKPQTVQAFEFLRIEPTPTEEHHDPNTVAESRALAADPHNRLFITYLDVHHVRLGGGYYANKPLIDTLDRILAPNDLFGVMTPMMRPSDIALGRKTDTVENELTKFWSWGRRGSMKIIPDGALRRACYADPPGGTNDDLVDPPSVFPIPIEIVERSWEDESLQSLEDLSAYLGKLRDARSAVLLLSDGWQQFGPNEALLNSIASQDAQNPGMGGQPPGIMVGPGGRLSLPGTRNAGQPGALDGATCMAEVSRLARLDDRRRLQTLIATAVRNNVTFYAINPDGLIVFDQMMGDPQTFDPTTQAQQQAQVKQLGAAAAAAAQVNSDLDTQALRVDGLMELADNTNGIAVVNTNDIAVGLKKVIDEVSAYYLIGYYSTNTKIDGTYRKIDVKVAQPGVKVAARRGYVAERTLPATKPAASSSIESAFGSLAHLQPDTELFVTGTATADAIVVSAEIPGRSYATWSAGADVSVIVSTATGAPLPAVTGKIDPGSLGALVRVPMGTTTGPWRAQVSVHGPGGSIENAADIVAPKGTLVGDPTIFRGTPSARSALRPVASRQFSRTERVHVEWPELTTLDSRQARLLGRNGDPLAVAVAVTERTEDGHPVLAADLTLGPLAPADYVIELTAGAVGKTETSLVAFRVQ